jgi:hypothetical protein
VASCPYCSAAYLSYRIVGVLPASEHLTYWLDPVPVAQLLCDSCGRITFMHPDHPDVQRLPTSQHIDTHAGAIRTLNVPVSEIGDIQLREQFARGRDEAPSS